MTALQVMKRQVCHRNCGIRQVLRRQRLSSEESIACIKSYPFENNI